MKDVERTQIELPEMKSTMSEMKRKETLKEIDRILDIAEEKMSGFEVIAIEMIPNET